MNRNTFNFNDNPISLDISRSRFNRDSSVKMSFNVGELIPFYVDEVLPGDTMEVSTSKVVRMQTLLTPIMDNMYLDTYYFFVPNRLVWDHWKEFQGENTESAWIPQTEYTVPQITAPSGGWSVGTIADYMGIPTGVENLSVNALPFRAYALICDYWFRSQNLQDPFAIPKNESTVVGSNGSDYKLDVAKGGKPWIARRYNDYFSQALPAPQKGPSVVLTVFPGGGFPVRGTGKALVLSDGTNTFGVANGSSNSLVANTSYFGVDMGETVSTSGSLPNAGAALGIPITGDTSMYVELPGNSYLSINELRTAFQLQKYYEQLARSGSRYAEILRSQFGVTSPDSRLQNPEYLGGTHIPITVNQVVQNSGTGTGSNTPQGTTAAYSLTADNHFDFSKSFVEHGFVIGVCVARYDHTYQQGIERFWSRKKVTDYYIPVFANLGEQGIRNKEIYAQGTTTDDEIFGYVPRWNEYRYKPSRVCGEMRSSFAQSLDCWHLADDYEALPTLSGSWLMEDKNNVDRVLAVTSKVSNQLFGDFYIQNVSTRAMPLHSIPGLIDHH
nr:MAG: major capsid protein [Microviridae sp.]